MVDSEVPFPISRFKKQILPCAVKSGQNGCAHRVQRRRKHGFTWFFCKNMTKNNSPNFYFLIQDSRHCCERAVYGDPSLHVRLLHSIIHAIYPSAGHVTRLGSPCNVMTKLYTCTQSGGHVTQQVT